VKKRGKKKIVREDYRIGRSTIMVVKRGGKVVRKGLPVNVLRRGDCPKE